MDHVGFSLEFSILLDDAGDIFDEMTPDVIIYADYGSSGKWSEKTPG